MTLGSTIINSSRALTNGSILDGHIELIKKPGELAWTSPVEERHVDFLLEEEFACNPEFLIFFVAEAARRSTGKDMSSCALPKPHEAWNCRAVRSVTTSKGETDVLVVYASAEPGSERTAILIEDKVRAGFQQTQAARYRERGAEGMGKHWDAFWTCLVSPKRYASENRDFDARVSLEALHGFFSGDSRRNIFKASVFANAILFASRSGVQIVHAGMTEYRAAYAAAAKARFGSELRWDKPRSAYDRDGWFCFRSSLFPSSAVITHKAEMGAVHLSLPHLSANTLQSAVMQCGIKDAPEIIQTGKSASFVFSVPKISFAVPFQSSESAVACGFKRVAELHTFWREHGPRLLIALHGLEI